MISIEYERNYFLQFRFRLEKMTKIYKLITIFFLTFNICSASVIIIGSGAAGIAAATRLLQNNVSDIIILEAENRIGGRIHSVPFGNIYVDLGAEYCDGQENNIVYNLVKKYDTLRKVIPGPSHIFYSNGLEVEEHFSKQLFNIMNRIYTANGNRNQTEGITIGEYCINRYLSEVINLNLSQQKLINITNDFMDFFHHYVINMEGAFSWFEPSAESDYRDTPGSFFDWDGKGFKTLLDIMTQRFSNDTKPLKIDDKIYLNKHVKNIEWDNKENYVRVNCSDESSYYADQIIFTPSVGVLKDTHRTMFIPELPLDKQLAIERIGINAVSKVILLFPNKWWPENFPTFNFVWSAEHRNTGFHNFTKNGKTWIFDATYLVPLDINSNLLSLRFTGRNVPNIELLEEAELLDGINFILKTFFGNTYKLSYPTSLVRSQFYANPHFRGTYSYQTIASRKVKTNEELAKPLFNKNGTLTIMFAGEATHSRHYSSVHGAIETGYREADRILNLFDK